jgi:hypothetical protein
MHSDNLTAGQVSQDTLEAICKLTHSGLSPEAISCALNLNIQTVTHFIARGDFESKDLYQEGNQCKQSQLVQEALIHRLQEHSDKTQANALNRDLAETSLQDIREALYHLHEIPTFI